VLNVYGFLYDSLIAFYRRLGYRESTLDFYALTPFTSMGFGNIATAVPLPLALPGLPVSGQPQKTR